MGHILPREWGAMRSLCATWSGLGQQFFARKPCKDLRYVFWLGRAGLLFPEEHSLRRKRFLFESSREEAGSSSKCSSGKPLLRAAFGRRNALPQERFATKKCGSGNPSSGQPLDEQTGALQGECSKALRYQKLRFGEALQGGCSRALRYQDLRPLRFQNRCASKTAAVRRPKRFEDRKLTKKPPQGCCERFRRTHEGIFGSAPVCSVSKFLN